MEITKEEFAAYVRVQKSGITNMFAVNVVKQYSGLPRDKILEIMKTYEQQKKRYTDV